MSAVEHAATPTSSGRTALWVMLAMLAFAGNSLLCRLALQDGRLDPAVFTALRLAAGALMLWLLLMLRGRQRHDAGDAAAGSRGNRGNRGSWPSAAALFVYAIAFSWAYTGLTAATGALLLFAAVHATMIGTSVARGERLTGWQWAGVGIAFAGLLVLLMPGLQAPSPLGAALMVASGVAWGIYTLRGRGAADPTAVTAGNFIRAVPLGLMALALFGTEFALPSMPVAAALASGALASGLGYAIWYAALPALRAATAATVQLSVPLIAAVGGALWLGEPVTARMLVAMLAIIGGIAVVIRAGSRTGRKR